MPNVHAADNLLFYHCEEQSSGHTTWREPDASTTQIETAEVLRPRFRLPAKHEVEALDSQLRLRRPHLRLVLQSRAAQSESCRNGVPAHALFSGVIAATSSLSARRSRRSS